MLGDEAMQYLASLMQRAVSQEEARMAEMNQRAFLHVAERALKVAYDALMHAHLNGDINPDWVLEDIEYHRYRLEQQVRRLDEEGNRAGE